MTNFLSAAILFLLPLFSFAASKASIHLYFNGPDGFSMESYLVPDQNVDAQVNLIRLSSESLENICYSGNAISVVSMLDRVVENAGSTVNGYSRLIQDGKILVSLKVVNKLKKTQYSKLEISRCK